MLKDYPTVTEDEKIVDEEEIIPEIKCPSAKYPCASDAVDVKYSELFGRHVIATRRIEPGEIIAVEKPYSKFVTEEKLYLHCTCCMRFVWAGIACDHCVNVVFCSEKCKAAAWEKYHRFECTPLDLILQYKCAGEGKGARIIFQMVSEAGGWEKLKERINKLSDDESKE